MMRVAFLLPENDAGIAILQKAACMAEVKGLKLMQTCEGFIEPNA